MSAPRTALHLLAPPPPDHLRDRFPAFTVKAGTEVFRCHSATRGPLWFANGGHGRFDLADENGTCYAAESEQITLLETWGGMRVVPSSELTARAVSRLEIVDTRPLADLTSNAAAQFGVIAEIFSTGNYQLTQLWAIRPSQRRLRRDPVLGAARPRTYECLPGSFRHRWRIIERSFRELRGDRDRHSL
ncbi:RES domain-containing protein [Rhodococcus sp. 14-2470-1b]|uniref:RES domain-containing protein n=1 Tax=Rhodococcus sp. 14-2470-1b TaxID=2023149 RepID=UPI0020CCB16F|nr:RES domain-containing protein [Rhodococcus sp. 14-2470-1b]